MNTPIYPMCIAKSYNEETFKGVQIKGKASPKRSAKCKEYY